MKRLGFFRSRPSDSDHSPFSTMGMSTGTTHDASHEGSDDSETERGGDDELSSELSTSSAPKRLKRAERRVSKEDWKVRYLMWPEKGARDGSCNEETDMICIQCQERMKAKSSTAAHHIDRKHLSSKSFSLGKKERLVKQFERMYTKQTSIISAALKPDELVKLAPYKLAFVIAKSKMPFSSCHAFVEFARAADPNSVVFSRMPGGRDTITRRTQDIHKAILKPSVVSCVHNSPFWSLVADESTDSATKEQLSVYVRYFDLDQGKLVEEFLEMKQVIGHPDANNIFKSLMEVLDPDISDEKLPLNRLAGFTTDGASVMISPKQGVLGKLRSTVNPKLFSSHCPLHRLVLAAKEGQKEIPDKIEKTLSDTLFSLKTAQSEGMSLKH